MQIFVNFGMIFAERERELETYANTYIVYTLRFLVCVPEILQNIQKATILPKNNTVVFSDINKPQESKLLNILMPNIYAYV